MSIEAAVGQHVVDVERDSSSSGRRLWLIGGCCLCKCRSHISYNNAPLPHALYVLQDRSGYGALDGILPFTHASKRNALELG